MRRHRNMENRDELFLVISFFKPVIILHLVGILANHTFQLSLLTTDYRQLNTVTNGHLATLSLRRLRTRSSTGVRQLCQYISLEDLIKYFVKVFEHPLTETMP
ncbi:hypothetical protein KIL84_018324 [Mauremys mutica]|uniref:Uncharacterized protein n=1 Tax=Mauremys mutica TaxID=74926 RepID=A0A9D3XUR1_9SAUR|nr:hypothetical protein KIL84_018324 [Mauremys mutica]